MLRSLVSEVVRRRLWPIPVAAILIAIAAPLLFMKSAPEAPVTTAPPVAAPGNLPAGAERLVTTSDKETTPRDKTTRKGQDPFAPPAGSAKASEDTAAVTPPVASTATVSAPPAGSVVIRNSDGSTSTMEVPKTATKKASTKKRSTTTKASTTKKPTTPKATEPARTTSSASAAPTVSYVDVRFGRRQDTMLRYRVPQLQTFRAGGRVAAMFSHYSAARDVAVFAIAPSTSVAGDVDCRKVKGVCRYVDIPAGSYARLRLRDTHGTLISRRLDVVHIRHLAGANDPMPRATTLDTAKCLLKGLLKLPASLPSISVDACD